jgi:gamma-glutamyltranspeptidase/glutathione hydrolase
LEEGKGSSFSGWRKVKDEANLVGHRSVSVPGAVRGLALALERFGTLSLGDAIAPAIRFAEEGIDASVTLMLSVASNAAKLRRFEATADIYLPDGVPIRAAGNTGPADRLIQPDLGQTLRSIAAEGPDAFYVGEIGREIAQHVQENGGLLSEGDLARYCPTIYEGGQRTSYRGFQVVGVPGACGSITAQYGLNILDGFDLPGLGAGTLETLHLEAEAFRRAFADRYRYLGDPSQEATGWRGMLSTEYAAERRAAIDVARAAPQAEPGNPHEFGESGMSAERGTPVGAAPVGGSTTHLSVADARGNLVALTQTLVNGFGSGVLVPKTGVLLNNAMSWFDPEPGRVNSIAPGKRGLNNMSPLVVLRDGRPLLALGAAGGRKIIQAVARVVANVIDHGMGLQEAIEAPRIDCSGTEVQVSGRIPAATVDGLEALGHRAVVCKDAPFTYHFASVLGVMVDPDTGVLRSGVDPLDAALAAGL